jgi:hypothetical protein
MTLLLHAFSPATCQYHLSYSESISLGISPLTRWRSTSWSHALVQCLLRLIPRRWSNMEYRSSFGLMWHMPCCCKHLQFPRVYLDNIYVSALQALSVHAWRTPGVMSCRSIHRLINKLPGWHHDDGGRRLLYCAVLCSFGMIWTIIW